MNLNELNSLFERYKIADNEYKELNTDNLTKLEANQIHKLSSCQGVYIEGKHLVKQLNETLYFDEAVIRKSALSLRIKDSQFIQVLFDDVTFNNCLFTRTYYINCHFKDCVFNLITFDNAYFINCSFDNVRLNDVVIGSIDFIDSDVQGILTSKGQTIQEAYNNVQIYSLKKEIYLATLPSKETDERNIEKAMDKNIMKLEENIITGETINSEIDLNGKSFNECIFSDIEFKDLLVDRNQSLIDNVFENVLFKNVTFVNTLLDGSLFKKCVFENCQFVRCSLIKTNFDVNCKGEIRFLKSNLFNIDFECSTDNMYFEESNFEGKRNVSEILMAKPKSLQDIALMISEIENVLSSDEFAESIKESLPPIAEDDVLGYFSNLDMAEAMQLIAKIMTSVTNVNTNKQTAINNSDMVI